MMVGRQTFSIKNGSFSDDIRSIFWGFHPIGGTETSDVLGEWAVCQVDAKAEAITTSEAWVFGHLEAD